MEDVNKFNKENLALHKDIVNRVEVLFDKGKMQLAAQLASDLADIECRNYVGYLSSNRLEHLLYKIAKHSFPTIKREKKKTSTNRVLHIGTEFYNIGGHTRVVQDWVKYDINSQSEILLIDQKSEFSLEMGAPIHYLKSKDLFYKVKELRDFISNNYFDVIVTHQHMHDVVTTLALWDYKSKSDTLILIYNHANFRFSLGNIVAHKRVNITSGDKTISEKYRYPIQDCVLPFVLGDSLKEELPIELKIKKRKELGIDNENVFVSIATAYKYKPFKGQNFFSDWNSFLINNPSITLVVIGCKESDFIKYCPNISPVSNLKLVGYVTDPTTYFSVSDYIVDAYPLSTGLGMLQGIYYGLPPVLPYAENAMVMGEEMKKLYPEEVLNLLPYRDKQSYFNFIEVEIKDKSYNKQAKPILNKFIEEYMLADVWRESLKTIYENNPQLDFNFSKEKDCLNTSEASNRWYEFTKSPTTTIALKKALNNSLKPMWMKRSSIYFRLIPSPYRVYRKVLRIIKKT